MSPYIYYMLGMLWVIPVYYIGKSKGIREAIAIVREVREEYGRHG